MYRRDVPMVVEEIPTGETAEVRYVLWRSRRSGGWFREAEGTREEVAREFQNEVKAMVEVDGVSFVDARGRYRVVEETVTTVAVEVPWTVLTP